MDLDKFRRLKATVDRCRSEADRAKGALDQLMDELRDKYNCDSLEAAEKEAGRLKADAEKKEREYGKALVAFEKKWVDVSDDPVVLP